MPLRHPRLTRPHDHRQRGLDERGVEADRIGPRALHDDEVPGPHRPRQVEGQPVPVDQGRSRDVHRIGVGAAVGARLLHETDRQVDTAPDRTGVQDAGGDGGYRPSRLGPHVEHSSHHSRRMGDDGGTGLQDHPGRRPVAVGEEPGGDGSEPGPDRLRTVRIDDRQAAAQVEHRRSTREDLRRDVGDRGQHRGQPREAAVDAMTVQADDVQHGPLLQPSHGIRGRLGGHPEPGGRLRCRGRSHAYEDAGPRCIGCAAVLLGHRDVPLTVEDRESATGQRIVQDVRAPGDSREDDVRGLEPHPTGQPQLEPRGDLGSHSQSPGVPHHGGRLIGLDRVGEPNGHRQSGPGPPQRADGPGHLPGIDNIEGVAVHIGHPREPRPLSRLVGTGHLSLPARGRRPRPDRARAGERDSVPRCRRAPRRWIRAG